MAIFAGDEMGWATAASVFTGAGFGALLRLALNERLNREASLLPLGTLAANLIGGYLIGLIAGLLLLRTTLSPELRPLLITGFLGGLTTFSAFSLELATSLQEARWGSAALIIVLHVAGSLVLTVLGLQTARLIAG